MPLGKPVQKGLYNRVMVWWEKPLEDWYSALRWMSRTAATKHVRQTCKMSSKSRAARRFISDVLLENVRMTPLPYDGTQRNLFKHDHFQVSKKDSGQQTCYQVVRLGGPPREARKADG